MFYWTFDRGAPGTYASLMGVDRCCGGLDAHALFVLGFYGYAFYNSVIERGEPLKGYLIGLESYPCLDASRDGALALIFPSRDAVCFVNTSVAKYNECCRCYRQMSGELDAEIHREFEPGFMDGAENNIRAALRAVDPSAVGRVPVYAAEIRKYWEFAIDDCFRYPGTI